MRVVSYNQLAELTGMAYRTIKKRLEEANINPVKREAKGAWFLPADALRAIYLGGAQSAEGKLDPVQEKALLDKAKREYQELKTAEAKGVLAPVEVTGKIIADLAINVRTKVLGIPSKMAAILPADIRSDAYKDLDKLAREILSDLAAYEPRGE